MTASAKRSRLPAAVTVVIVVVVVAVVGGIVGIAIYRNRVKPFTTTVLEVDGTPIGMRYFLKRVAMSGQSPISTLQMLAQEELIKETAPKPPYNLTITAEEADTFIRTLARGDGEALSESEFKEWYRQQLNQSRLTDGEYRDLSRTRLLSLKLSEYLGERIPAVAEQILVNMIPVKDSTLGAEVKAKYQGGADFAVLAREYSSDPDLKKSGGRLGWVPRGVLDPGLEEAAFGLKIRACSDPIYFDEQTVIVIMVSARVAAGQIDARSRKTLKAKALDEWLKGEYPKHKVTFHGFKGGYDTATDAWVHRELQKMSSLSGTAGL